MEGNDYQFKIRTQNVYGWSDFSDVVTVRASEAPQQPAIATTSTSDDKVRITWQAADDKGDPVTAYRETIKQADGVFSENVEYCDASVDPVFTNLYCEVPMSVLRDTAYSLGLGDLVQAKVLATNAVGDSEYSQENVAGATVETEPATITTLGQDLTSQSLTWIVLTWDALTTQAETGGSPILNYKVRWNQGSLDDWVDLVTIPAGDDPLTYKVESLTGGQYYRFTVLAENIHGWGQESAVFIENAASPPSQPDPIVTSYLNTNIKVVWT